MSLVESKILKHLQEQLGLTDEEARTVRDKILEPYGKYRENLDQYKQTFTELVDEQGYPLGEKAKAGLKKLQQYLNLKDDDVAPIHNEAEVQKQQAEILQQLQEAQRLKLEREQQEAQRLQRQREQEEAQRLRLQQQSTANDLPSEKGVDYRRLRDLLKAKQWKEADQETLAVMLEASGRKSQGWLSSESINNFPCTDLRTIDQLWVKYSNGHFGFSVQKRIWENVGKDYEKFGDRVGWRKEVFFNKNWRIYSDLAFTTNSPQGHLPVAASSKICDFMIVSSFIASRLVNCNI
ncbi:GUN4 domain-containing protein [Nostoc linckia FACHB-391]|uniref:GUN4 domain-containing protein n=2 Tax=Nostoc TaxID=1177 RepID=A0ABR8I7S1_9NOSO|nr:GUN4 domain-containing protein [Nostoc linckia FACHB-391]MBD2647480.1 GUN4 domain-containing protein [Nostoc foliaceum FACHB-393]